LGKSFPSHTREQRLIYNRAVIPAIEIFKGKSEEETQAYLMLVDLQEEAGRTEEERGNERDRRVDIALAFARTEEEEEKIGQRLMVAREIGRALEKMLGEMKQALIGAVPLEQKFELLQRRMAEMVKKYAEAKALEHRLGQEQTEGNFWGKAWEKTKEQLDVSKWSPEKRAVVGTATLGAVALGVLGFWLYRRWRRKQPTPSEQQGEREGRVPGWVYLIPGVGLAVVAAYAGHKMLMKVDAYAKGMERAQETAKRWYQWGRDQMPFVGCSEAERLGITEDQFRRAEEVYRTTRANPDVKKIKEIFGLREGETSPAFEKFMKDMKEKYERKEVNGVTYARADVALASYERSLERALRELGYWVDRNKAVITAAGIALHTTGLLKIQDILKAGTSVAVKAKDIALTIGGMVVRHPLLSLFTVGGAFLGVRLAVSASKKVYLPENFQELGKAFSRSESSVAVDEQNNGVKAVNDQVTGLREEGAQLREIGSDYDTWLRAKITDFGRAVLEQAPERIGLRPEETVEIRNRAALRELRRWLEGTGEAARDNTQKNSEGLPDRCDIALQRLNAYEHALIAERATTVSSSAAPGRAYEELEEALRGVDVTLTKRDGIVYWQCESGEEMALSVDPSIKNRDEIHEHSERMPQGREGFFDYVFFRMIHNLREKEQRCMERVHGNTVIAMVLGNFVYFTDPWNHGEYWMAPVTLAAELFPGSPWGNKPVREKVADVGAAMTEAALVSLSVGALSRLKRLAVGGGPLLFKKDWAKLFGYINPLTSPMALVRDAARGVVDFETFLRLGGASGREGVKGVLWTRRVNSFLAAATVDRAGQRVLVRPEWIDIIENSDDMRRMRFVGRQVGVGNLPLDPKKAKEALKEAVVDILRHTRQLNLREFEVLGRADCDEIYDACAMWGRTRGKVSRLFERMGNVMDSAAHPVRSILRGTVGRLFTGTKSAAVAGAVVEGAKPPPPEGAAIGETAGGATGDAKAKPRLTTETGSGAGGARPKPTPEPPARPSTASSAPPAEPSARKPGGATKTKPAEPAPASKPSKAASTATVTETPARGANRISPRVPGGDGAATEPYFRPTETQLKPSADTAPKSQPKVATPESPRPSIAPAAGETAKAGRSAETTGETADVIADVRRTMANHKPTQALLQGERAEEYARLIEAAHDAEGLSGAKRVSRYLLTLRADVPAAMRAPEVLEMVASGHHGNPAAIARFLNTAPIAGEITGESVTNALRSMSNWQKTRRVARGFYIAGAVAEAGFVGWEYFNAYQTAKTEEQLRLDLISDLTKVGLQQSKDNPNVYEGFGVEVKLDTLLPTEFEAAVSRYTVGAAGLATTLVMSSAMLGPPGLVVAGVTIAAVYVADTFWKAKEQESQMEFMSRAPAWLVAQLGTDRTIRRTPYETMLEFDGVMASDIVPTTLEGLAAPFSPYTSMTYRAKKEMMKHETREKALLAHLYYEFSQDYPEYLAELPGGGEGVKSFLAEDGEFLKKDGSFDNLVKKYIDLRLHSEMGGEEVSFSTTQSLDISERQGGFGDWLVGAGFRMVSEHDLENAVEEGMLLLTWSEREKRHWKRMDDIEKQAEGKSALHKEALIEAYYEECDEDPPTYFIFNVHPRQIPRRNDRKTWAEYLIDQRTSRTSMATKETSPAVAGEGFRLPWMEQAVSIREFARTHIRPRYTPGLQDRLKGESPKEAHLPTFDELEQMWVDSCERGGEFAMRFMEKLQPVLSVERTFSKPLKTDEDLKTAIQEQERNIDAYLAFMRNREFYYSYLNHWRRLSLGLPEDRTPFVSLLKRWINRGSPTLISEAQFGKWREHVERRRLEPPAPQGQRLPLLPRMREERPRLELHLPGMIAGLDLAREGVAAFSLGGYQQFALERARALPDERLRLEDPFRDPAALLRLNLSGRGLSLSPGIPRQPEGRPIRVEDLRRLQERQQVLFDGWEIPLSMLEATYHGAIALTEEEVSAFMQTISLKEGEQPRPQRVPSDEFQPLRQYLLQSRVMVMVDRNPAQQSLRLNLGR
jgi:hypothetical protein